MAQPPPSQQPAPPSSRPGPRQAPSQAYVLLVEDIATNRVLTATLLRRHGHRIDVAANGREAIAMVSAQPYDLVLMDLVMPGMDGYAAARHIRALAAPSGKVAIVALTANDSPEAQAACRAAGMNGLLAKPVRPQALLEMLGHVLGPPATPSTAAPALALVDSERLMDLQRGLPPGLFAALLADCLADIQARLPLLHDALAAGQEDAARDAAHALAGMAANYGLTAFEQRLRGIMAATTSGNITLAGMLALGVPAELEDSAVMIRSLLSAAA